MRETDLFQLDTFLIHEAVRPAYPGSRYAPESCWSACLQCCRLFLPAFCQSQETGKYTGLHGADGWRSAIEIIVQYEVTAFARDPWFNRLIQHKWNKFGRWLYILRVVSVYAILSVFFGAVVILRCKELAPTASGVSNLTSAETGPAPTSHHRELSTSSCAAAATGGGCGLKFDQQIRQAFSHDCGSTVAAASLVMEGILAGPWAVWLFFTGWRQRKISFKHLDVNGDRRIAASEVQEFVFKNLHFILDVLSGFVLFFAGMCRVQCWEQEELRLLAVGSILLFSNALNVLVPFRYVGEMVITVYRMIVGDVFRFLVVYGLICCGFSFAMALMCQHVDFDGLGLDGHQPDDPSYAFLNLGFVSLGDNIGGFIFDLYPRTQDPGLTLGIYFTWVIISSVLVSR